MNINETKKKIYESIDYSNEISLQNSLVKLESILSSSIKISNDEKDIYNDAINEIKDCKNHGICISDKSIVIKHPEKIILSEGKVYTDRNGGVMIGCFDDDNRNYSKSNAYFKFCDAENYKKCKKVARITFVNPHYIYHDGDKKESWALNRHEVDLLNKIVRMKLRGATIWSWLCYEFVSETKKDIGLNENDIPDFRVLLR